MLVGNPLKSKWLLLQFLFLCLFHCSEAQHIQPSTQALLDKLEQFQLRNQRQEAIKLLNTGITETSSAADLAHLYAYQSGLYVTMDSLLVAKHLVDQSMENALKSRKETAIAVAYRSKAFLNNGMNLQDSVVKDALEGLKHVENNEEDLRTKYHLNYLLYSAYSRWEEDEKMENYIRKAQYYALESKDINLQVNVSNGLSSMYLARYKKGQQQTFLDSSFHYLTEAFELRQKFPTQVSGNTLVITCVNLANYYLDFATGDLTVREQKAFQYLRVAEEKLKSKEATPEKWMNVFGIKSDFAMKRGDLAAAETYLVQGLSQLMRANGNYFKLEYNVNKALANLALKKDDLKSALSYQQRAEDLLKKAFNEQQLFNAQKLEVQYETARKDQELILLKEREDFRIKQNYLYGGIALALLFGLVFMFVSYHFKLRYSVEREKKLVQEKQDAEQQAVMQLELEKQEQKRMLVEQELLDLRRQQLEKEALANSLIIDRKNDTLMQIQDKIHKGESGHIQKLLKEEMLLQADFEDIKTQVHALHPDFFKRLNERAIQKLTPLDLKYCTYLHLKMSTKQIAQALHVEPQSVRMSKYRLKQKFGLKKEDDFEDFLST